MSHEFYKFPMMYFYTTDLKDYMGYQRAGWVEADTEEDALLKIMRDLGSDAQYKIEISFKMTTEEFNQSLARSWQGD